MDTRRSYYLASRQDDFDSPAPDEDWVDFSDIPMWFRQTITRGSKTVCQPAAALCFVV
jgi:hypothetical protein